MLYYLYCLLGFLASGILYPFFVIHPRGRRRLKERYGAWHLPRGSYVWFHGASIGEVKGLQPLIELWRQRHPEDSLLLTSLSPSGIESVSEDFDGDLRLIPFDNPLWLQRALKNCEIKAFIFGETECWPAVLSFLKARSCPSYLVNATVLSSSFSFYKRLKVFFKPVLQGIESVSAASELYASRFEALSIAPEKIRVCGNAKYAQTYPSVDDRSKEKKRDDLLLGSKKVLVLGSIRPSEEHLWFSALEEVEFFSKAWSLILAPRHEEKFSYFAEQLEKSPFSFLRFSTRGTEDKPSFEADVLLLDTFGKLFDAYAVSQAAFVGASLIPGIGGHNPLEPISLQVPTVMGQHFENSQDIVESLLEKKAITIVRSKSDIKDFLQDLLNESAELKAGAKRGFEVWQAACKAPQKIMQHIEASYQGSDK